LTHGVVSLLRKVFFVTGFHKENGAIISKCMGRLMLRTNTLKQRQNVSCSPTIAKPSRNTKEALLGR